MLEIPNTPIVIQFLATSLARFIEMSTLYRKPWSKLRVAEYITASEDISGKLSDTTLGRFLDPEYPQKPTDGTVSAIAQFLLHQRVITSDQLKRVHESSPHWKATIFAGVFDTPQTKSFQRFLQNMSGRYASMHVVSEKLLLSEIIIEYMPSPNALVVNEIMSLYQIRDINYLSRKTSNFDPIFAGMIDTLLHSGNARLMASVVTTGFATATTEIAAFFNRPTARGFSSVFNITNLIFSQNDKISGFKGNRNVGWAAEELGQIMIPNRSFHLQNSVEKIRYMSADLSYIKVFFEKTQSMRDILERPETKSEDGLKPFHFDTKKLMTEENTTQNKSENTLTSDEQLIEAFEGHDLSAFIAALENGANPNLIPPKHDEPLVFLLARDGEIDWIEPLVKLEACDLTQTDCNGFPPSHAPSVVARQFNETQIQSETSKRFGQIAQLLQGIENRQSKELAVPPEPSS
ncbi:MAG: hypothetical protein GQ535_02930 [Rhodobacteraceae bacterium]|nr:hypothetical protein [Paracoccaceae bacterium]